MKTDRRMLREYMLGALPEALATELDAALFAEDDLHRELQDEQDSLIEDFVYGRLTREEHITFQSQCAQSPLLQQKVESFRRFLSALERQSDQAPPWRALYFVATRSLSPALALMLCVASFLYIKQLRRNTSLIAQLQNSSHAFVPVAPSSGGKPVVTVAFLSANVPRGPSAAPDITVPASASVCELQVELRPPATGEVEWDIELLRGNEVISTSAHVLPRRIGQEAFLPLVVDAGSLRAGFYTVRYAPRSHPGTVQFRLFHVVN